MPERIETFIIIDYGKLDLLTTIAVFIMVVSSLTPKQRMLIEEVSHYFIAISNHVPYRCVSGASAVPLFLCANC